MKQLFPDLWQTETYKPSSFLKTQSYLLKTKKGNALLYNTGLQKELDEIEELGGLTEQYLTHRHESGKNLKEIRSRFNSKLVCDSEEAKFISSDCEADQVFDEEIQFENRLIAYPTPGHTSGGCCYYYDSPEGEKYLFTGDLFYVDGDKFSTFVYAPDGGSNSELIKSLYKLSELNPTIVLSSAFGGKQSSLKVTTEFWESEIARNIKQLQ